MLYQKILILLSFHHRMLIFWTLEKLYARPNVYILRKKNNMHEKKVKYIPSRIVDTEVTHVWLTIKAILNHSGKIIRSVNSPRKYLVNQCS